MSNALESMPTVAPDDGIEASHHNNVAANIRTLSRNFWDDGSPDLALSEQKKGTSWVDPTTLAMWIFRIDGEGDPRDAASPLRPTWHWDDFEGSPPDDGRTEVGDCLIWDSGEGDTYVLYRDADRFRGLGVLIEPRELATGTDSTTKRQSSDRLQLRGSSWDGDEAVNRDWSLRVVIDTAADGGDDYSLYFEHRAGEGSWSSPFSIGRQGSFSFAGNSPCVTMNFVTGGTRALIFGSAGTQADGQEFLFKHLGTSKLARFRFAGASDERDGALALALSAIYGSAATVGSTMVKSASLGGTASYWDGAAAQEASWYDQLILTSTDPSGYIRRGFGSWGPGTLDLYESGKIHLNGTVALGGDWGEADGAGQIYQQATYTGLHTLDRHGFRILPNPICPDGATVTDGCRDVYPEGAGSSISLDGPAGGAIAWEKISEDSQRRYTPAFADKAVNAVRIGGSAVALYAKTLSSGEVSWDVAGDGFASVVGVVATVKSTGGGGGGGGPQVVADASDPQALTGVGGTEDYAIAFIDGPGIGLAIIFPESMDYTEIGTMFGMPPESFAFVSNDGSFTSSPGPVLVHAGAGSDYTWDNTPLDDSTVGAISTSPGAPTLEWNGSAYEATYAEWTLGATTYEYTYSGSPLVDSYFFLAAGGGGGGGGGGSPAALGWSVDGTTVTVTDGSGSSGDDVSVIVWGAPS